MVDRILCPTLVLTHRIILTDLLLDPAIFKIVTGLSLPSDAAVRQETTVDDSAKARLDFYAAGLGAAMERPVMDVELAKLVITDYMALYETHQPEDARRALPQIAMRAASRMRARAEPSPATLAPPMTAKVERAATRYPYTDYFAVREDDLAFPRFSGGMSPIVKRASFMGGDAVTVLPFDPAQGKVLMVRQFRHGPYARGDENPWTLEPAAGRIDPGETPEETARRELLEETGLAAGAVHFVGRYYPTPGAFSEYLYSYVATANLDGRDGGLGGLEDEAEDIMAHVVPLDAALAMIETGEVNTGPLILSLHWLALNRHQFD